MVATITPAVHGRRSKSRYLGALALHALGAACAAGLLGALLGAVGRVLGAPWGGLGTALLAAAGIVYALRELAGLPVPLPEARRQVPEWWRTFYSPPVAALLYGLGLGVGFGTFIKHGTFVVVAAAALAGGDPLVGLVLCAPFGLARASTAVLGIRPRAALNRIEAVAQSRAPRLLNGAALIAVAAAALLGA